jgi:hypothetical protein
MVAYMSDNRNLRMLELFLSRKDGAPEDEYRKCLAEFEDMIRKHGYYKLVCNFDVSQSLTEPPMSPTPMPVIKLYPIEKDRESFSFKYIKITEEVLSDDDIEQKRQEFEKLDKIKCSEDLAMAKKITCDRRIEGRGHYFKYENRYESHQDCCAFCGKYVCDIINES